MQEPTRIGKYEIVELIGRGGMGSVYKAIDTVIRRQVAIKMLSEQFFHDENARRRFLQEAQAIGHLQHPGIITIHDTGEHEQRPYLVVELLKGCDLDCLLKEDRLPPTEQLLGIMIKVCEALEYSHDQGIIHRDIKPGNIFICDDGNPRLMDFGIAKLQDSGLTKTGMLLGTINYMSPEQIQGSDIDKRTDLFSFGIVMFECFSKNRPFEGESMTAVMSKILFSDPDPFTPRDASLPPVLNAVISKCLMKNQDDRYQSAEELSFDLTKIRMMLAQARMVKQSAAAQAEKSATTAVRHEEKTKKREVTPDTAARQPSPLPDSKLTAVVKKKSSATLKLLLVLVVVAVIAAGTIFIFNGPDGQYYETLIRHYLARMTGPSTPPGKADEPEIKVGETAPLTVEKLSPTVPATIATPITSVQQKPVPTAIVQVPTAIVPVPTVKSTVQPDNVTEDDRYSQSLALARQAESRKDWATAISASQEALTHRPNDPQAVAIMKLARKNFDAERKVARIASNIEDARRSFQSRQLDQAIQAVDRVLVLEPRHTEALKLKKDIELARVEASRPPVQPSPMRVEEATPTIEQQPQVPINTAGTDTSILKLQGQHAFGKGQYQECIDMMNVVLNKDPTDAFALNLKRNAEAKIIGEIAPASIEIQTIQMKQAMVRGNFDIAAELASSILSRQPDHAEALHTKELLDKRQDDSARELQKNKDIANIRNSLTTGSINLAYTWMQTLKQSYPQDPTVIALDKEVEKAWQTMMQPTPTPLPSVRIVHKPPQSTLSGKKLIVDVDIEGLPREMLVTLFYRKTASPEWKSMPMQEQKTRYVATIPADDVQIPGIEYFIIISTRNKDVIYNGEKKNIIRVKVVKETPGSVPFF